MKNYTLITGASSGIGKELALIASREKRNLLLISRDEAKLNDVKNQTLQQAQGNKLEVKILAIDLSKAASAKKVFDFCKTNRIFVNELINNAGFGDYSEFSKSDLNKQLSMIDLNIRSLTELTHLFLQSMVENNSGKIMNLGSVAGFLPGPLMSVYFASKNYVVKFSEALSEELRGTNVTVTCLCPGSTKTDFGKNAEVSATHSTANPKTTARQVAEYGWNRMQAGQAVAIYGISNKLAIFIAHRTPRKLLARLVKRIQK